MTQIQPQNNAALDAAGAKPTVYCVGTLVYTKMGLLSVCLWLLGGDFFFMLMETVVPTILPLKFKSLDAPNWMLSLAVFGIPSFMNMMVNPILAFRSDRYRSRLGRRIPFLLFATPFIVIFLILIGFSDSIGGALHSTMIDYWPGLSAKWVILGLLCIMIAAFQFFNMFVGSIYYYLFNDVVPPQFLARFLAIFRAVGIAAMSFYNFFIYQHAMTHMREIFIGAALLFGVIYTVMCLKIKEGQYPPPPENVDGKKGFVSSAKTYFNECFRHRIYIMMFLSNSFWLMVGGLMMSFQIFFLQSLGFTLKQYGTLIACVQIVSAFLLYPMGVIVDKLHPLPVIRFVMLSTILVVFSLLTFLFFDIPQRAAFFMIIGYYAILIPSTAGYTAAQLPMYMSLLPKDRFGQFCSADAVFRSIILIIGSFAVGLFLDVMKIVCARFGCDEMFYYRFFPCWNIVFLSVGLFFMNRVYKEWKKLGGKEGYCPPGFERPQDVEIA